MLVALSAGAFIDRGGSKLPIQAGSVALILGSMLRAAADDIPVLLGGQVLVGLANLLVFLSVQSHISVVSRPGDQAKNFGSWSFVTSAGQMAGPLLGGVLAGFLAVRGDVMGGYRAVFLATVGLGAASLAAGTGLRQTPARRETHLSPLKTLRAAGRLLETPAVAMGAWTSMALMLNAEIRRSFFPVYSASLGLSATGIGFLMSSYAVASMAVRPFLASMARHWGSLRTLVISLALCGVGWGLVPFVGGFWALFAMMIVAGAGVGIGSPLTMVLVVEGAEPRERGLGLGIRQTGNRVADFLSPTLYGAVAGVAGLASTFFLAAGFAVWGLILALRIGSRLAPLPAPSPRAGRTVPGEAGSRSLSGK